MKTETYPFDVSKYLDSPEMIHEYLKAVCEIDDSDLLISALGHIAKARGMSEIAKQTGLSRQNLYKALTPGASPKFETVKKVIEALGYKFSVA